MIVANAIKLLKKLDPNAEIACQWYEQEDMGTFGGETLTTEEWELANAIFDRYELSDMRYALEQAIYEAKQRLANKEE
jgi:hypothetical protein